MEEKDTNRSIFQNENNKDVDISKQLFGLVIFILVFVVMIPYILFKYHYFGILEGYIPNIDMIATVVGFQRKPFLDYKEYFKFLYNPDVKTPYGYFSQTFINYLALLGLTFFISYYTFKSKSLVKGWSHAFIMLPMTYLLPGNFISYYMSKVNDYLNSQMNINNEYMKDILVYGVGGITILLFIFLEKFMIRYFSDFITTFLSKFIKV